MDEPRAKALDQRGASSTGLHGMGLNAPDHIEQFFAFAHLPAHLQTVSKPFGDLAQYVVATLPRNPERTIALRKLLEAKDAAVRALVAK